jgi:amino acid transporter
MFTALTASLASAQGQPRLWFRMAKDGLLPNWLCELDKSGTPVNAILMTGAITSIVSCLVNVDSIYNAIIVGVLLMQAFVCIGCLMHESKDADRAIGWDISALSLLSLTAGALLQYLNNKSLFTLASFCTASVLALVVALFVIQRFEASKRVGTIIPLVATMLNFFFMGNMGYDKVSKLLLAYAIVSLLYFF